MGYEDRDYYREDDAPSGFRFGSEMSMNTRLMLACGIVFLLNLFLFGHNNNWLSLEALSLHGDTILQPWLWFQYVTYAFVHDPDPKQLHHIILSLLGMYFFGPEIERHYGSREYLRIVLATILLGGIFWSLHVLFREGLSDPQNTLQFLNAYEPLHTRPYTAFGIAALSATLTLLFCMHYPKRDIMLFGVMPVPAWLIGIMILFQSLGVLFSSIASGAPWPYEVDMILVGCIFSVMYFRFQWHLGDLPGVSSLGKVWEGLKKMFKPKPNLKVYDSTEEDAAYTELETEADRILDKLHSQGEASLSPPEKKLLERYSRLMRQKHR
jgi:membrane associated rhomboid family serine protease